MRDLIVLTWGFASIPFAFLKPFYGLCVFSILAYNRTQDLTWGSAADYRLSFYIAVATMLGFLFRPPEGRYMVFELRTWVTIFLLVLVSLSVVFAVYPEASYHKFYEYLKIIIVAMITPPLLNSRERIRTMLWVIGLSLGFYGVKNGLFFERTLQGPGGMLLDNNDFSAALVMNLPILLYLGLSEEKKWVRRGFLASVPLSLIAIALTESRGGFLAMVATCGVMVLKSRHRAMAIAAAPFLAIVFWIIMPQSFKDRIATLRNPTADDSAQARLDAWQTALRMSADYPWFGVGYVNFQSVYNRYSLERDARDRVAHNSYLQLMAESGRPSLLVFLTLLALTIGNCRSLQSRGRRMFGGRHWFVQYAAAIEISFYGYIVAAMFLNRAHFDLLYHLVAISIALNRLAKIELREAAAARSTEPSIASRGLAMGGA